MTKTEITDEMVERARVACPVPQRLDVPHADVIRHMLDAALNPPEEAEIVVTEAMHRAGVAEWHAWIADKVDGRFPTCICRVYVAMERARLKERDAQPKPRAYLVDVDARGRGHRRSTDFPIGKTQHRRKGDPR